MNQHTFTSQSWALGIETTRSNRIFETIKWISPSFMSFLLLIRYTHKLRILFSKIFNALKIYMRLLRWNWVSSCVERQDVFTHVHTDFVLWKLYAKYHLCTEYFWQFIFFTLQLLKTFPIVYSCRANAIDWIKLFSCRILQILNFDTVKSLDTWREKRARMKWIQCNFVQRERICMAAIYIRACKYRLHEIDKVGE